jgi:vacuolar-type H+-ATPase subunit H
MTNYNERLDEIFKQVQMAGGGLTSVDRRKLIAEAKQAHASLIKELVAEAKPLLKEKIASIEFIIWDRKTKVVGTFESETDLGFNKVINEFEQNLLKGLEEV